MTWQRRILAVAMVAIVVAAVASWVAVGLLADGVQRSLVRIDESLETAADIAVETADTLETISSSLGVVGDGLVSTSDALASTRDLSETVRDILSSIRFIDSVQELRENLLDVEDALVAVEADLGRAGGALDATAEQLDATADEVRAIPATLAAGRDDLAAIGAQLDTQVRWWRLAIVAFTVALFAVMWVIYSNLESLRILRELEAARTPG
jgi:ABC-type transporter Mla subunit MlaD